MDRIQTSTPLIYDKFLPPPPRKLWAADSPAEILYRNKWTKYRNTFDISKDNWNRLDATNLIDFDIIDARDNNFDNAEEDNETPKRFNTHQRNPGLDLENNNVLDAFARCSMSMIKKFDDDEEKEESKRLSMITVQSISDVISVSQAETILADEKMQKIKSNFPSSPSENNVEQQKPLLKKNCTTTEPFSFEIREKFRQEHNQARRERDSFGKEPLKRGFRANPRPNYLRASTKMPTIRKTCMDTREANGIDLHKIYTAAEIWKKKAYQPKYQKKLPIVPKAPELLTAVRARERQLFEDRLKEREHRRQILQKKEEAERKKEEEKQIAELRKKLVHKAQPIRKYKLTLPKVEKRPPTESITPIKCKRQKKC